MQRRSVSRRMEERPLLTPDDVRRLNPDQAILIPERQNPLLVHRIVYFQDPTFRKLFEAQKGALPHPPKEAAEVRVLTERMEALERQLAERTVVDFVRPEKVKAATPIKAEPKLAAEIVAREGIALEVEPEAVDAAVPFTPDESVVAVESEVHLDMLKPSPTMVVSRMSKFTQKLAGP